MTRTPALALAAIAAALLVPIAASGWVPPPPAKCSFKLKKQYRLSSVVKRGLTVKTTCDAATRVDTSLDWRFGTKQDIKWVDSHGGGTPGISFGPPKTLRGPGTVTLRNYLTPEARRFARRYRRTRITVRFAQERPDKKNVFRSTEHGDTVVVR